MRKFDSASFVNAAAPALKLVGLILVLITFSDYLSLAIFSGLPAQPTTAESMAWRVNLTEQGVDRGSLSLVGFALLLNGFWIDSAIEDAPAKRKAWKAIGFTTFAISSLLGLIFLLLAPLHLSGTNDLMTERLKLIAQESTQAEGQIDNQVNANVQQRRAQILNLLQNPQVMALLQNEEQLKQAIARGQIPANEATLLQQFRANPTAIDQFLDTQVKQQLQGEAAKAKEEIRKRKETAERQTQTEIRRSALRTTLRGVLTAIGHAILGWVGLRAVAISTRRSILDDIAPDRPL